jgi:DNA replication and repair protein RecF
MFLQKINLINFKNYEQSEMIFSEKINCFIGDNGVGKTNILDAIYYLSFCKSYFNSVDSQNIKHEQSFFSIHGNYFKNGNKNDVVSCIQKRNSRKVFKLNKKEYDRLADHIGHFPLVMISPYDRDLINEGSDVRRKYIDGVISQFDKFYLDDLLKYNRALFQRNSLLKKFSETNYFNQDSLDIWNEQLIKLGKELFEKRKSFLNEFIPIFQHYFEFISGNKEKVSIRYNSQLIDNNFEKLLVSAQQKDRMMRYTTIGTHKDDLDLLINGFPVKKFGSQGQQKSFVIAIKLAQFDFTKNKKAFKPVLLFDDIFDKLDDSRVKQLIQLVSENNFGQVFITDTQRQRIEKIFKTVNIDHKIFEISNAVVTEIKKDWIIE